MVDHINGDTLDNREVNLRVVTRSQNSANADRPPNGTGYRGVRKLPSGRFQARIHGEKGGKLGTFDAVEDAARAYDKAARERYGECARVNF
jgi:hypothetical protein